MTTKMPRWTTSSFKDKFIRECAWNQFLKLLNYADCLEQEGCIEPATAETIRGIALDLKSVLEAVEELIDEDKA